ncbi:MULTISPECIES: ROK family protein [Brevibacillus]|uniref:Transcriptional regulator n=1 Tax=Brevibacillus borstelensis AK1 TaxID=1300222 RepID=M8E8V3_9BACL|nr:ROK family transcriptional regulator [Brevibacillus borstelensis]EMT51910.1 transcriptional regulator [Brevibacillus borstelensis AK1]KKX56483.1 transcriptional regulator [Brevibacillus borstelensis cifa_chp40]MBE5398285.1 ROK family protein [Brevibacillus borstelensis]MCC0564769.1 ROK family protein [Brevibacillus borstelensis]MCM3468795.1 ROK family protein [Brevibacillus borstelensis]
MRSSKRTGSSKLVKKWNKEEILQQVILHGQISRADLSKETQLSRPCVSALVDEMIQEGLLHEVGMGDSRGGRKPILLEYNYQAYAIAGAVFEGSTLDMAVADLKGRFLGRYQKRLSQPGNGELVIEDLAQGLERLLEESSLPADRLLGIGVGLPGVTQRGSGTVSFSPSTGWMGSPIQKTIEERLGLPVIIDNDVNMMTLGEYVRGVGVGHSTVVYMYVGTGIGSGIILDGQFYRGSREAAGEIGFMMIGPANSRKDGASGVFETHYSAPGIACKAKGFLSDLQEGSSVIKELIRYAEKGHEEAVRLLDEVYLNWAYGIANIVSILNPELLILSGEMVHIDDKGVKRISDWLSEWVPVAPRLEKAALGEQAGLIGAVHSVLEAFPSTRLLDR